MAVLVNKNSKVMVQGMTGEEGKKASGQMIEYGTNIVCGVTPGKGGQEVHGKPIYNSVADALAEHPEVNTSVLYVPPFRAKGACLDAFNAGVKLVVCITENIPIRDVLEMVETAKEKDARLIGPSSIGVMSSEIAKIGSIGGANNHQYMKGSVGIISKSGGMSSETALLLKNEGIGTSTVIGMGGDVICGTDFAELMELFEKDDDTKVIVLYGEIGGEYEQEAARTVKEGRVTKPVVAFVSGTFAENLPHVTLGHAGAIVEGENGTRRAKVKALEDAGVRVANIHHEIVDIVKDVLDK